MTFIELLAAVYDLTNRPDLVTETKQAVQAATLKIHTSDFYSKDIHEVGIQFDSASFRQSLDYYTLITNFRSVKYLKRVESATDDKGKFFDIISVDEVLDAYNRNRTDIAYVAGRVIEIRASVEWQFGLFGAYVMPIVREEAFVSWVADMYPFTIVYEATRRIFVTVGQREEANGYAQLLAEDLSLMKLSAVTDVGN